MRYFPEDKYDLKHLEKLNASEWQIDLLKKNPPYCSWGNFEDYMSKTEGGWDKRVDLKIWSEHFGLDELNELVNFYFELYRKNHECPHCEGSGQNPATKRLADDWYDFDGTGRRWCDKISDVEVVELAKHGRLSDYQENRTFFDDSKNKWIEWRDGAKVELDEAPKLPSATEVNMAQNGRGFGHDAISRWICVETRAKHLGVYGTCEYCEGGVIYDEPNATIALQLWFLHPRKGCSRGVYIERIEEHEMPDVIKYLKEAAERNASRFSKL